MTIAVMEKGKAEQMASKDLEIEIALELKPETKDLCERLLRIVHCKDCKWYGLNGCAVKVSDDSDKPKDDDYCSFGERKEQEHE